MILITEAQSSAIVTPELAFAAVRDAFIAAVAPGAASFAVVHGHGSDPQNRFTIKSASGAELAGLKVGAYFSTNDARGLPRLDDPADRPDHGTHRRFDRGFNRELLSHRRGGRGRDGCSRASEC